MLFLFISGIHGFSILDDNVMGTDPESGPTQRKGILDGWRSIDEFRSLRSRSGTQPSKKRPLSPNIPPTSVRRCKPSAHVQPQSRLSSAIMEPSEEESSDDSEIVPITPKYKSIMIGDTEAVDDVYYDKFIAIQQIPCKAIAKAWIKVLEPKKQANHPYNGGKRKEESMAKYGRDNPGALSSPNYWPSKNCRHKEPDHIYKDGTCVYQSPYYCH